MRTIQSLTLGSILQFFGIIALIVVVVSYVQFQARNLLLGPTVDLTSEYIPVQHSRSVNVTGIAHNIVKLTLNGREITTDESGAFNQTLVLENGYTIMELTAQDRFGRMTSVIRKYVYVPPSA